ncbi:hypothetical protein H4R27_006217, partial [Coemansia aciculifera]
ARSLCSSSRSISLTSCATSLRSRAPLVTPSKRTRWMCLSRLVTCQLAPSVTY